MTSVSVAAVSAAHHASFRQDGSSRQTMLRLYGAAGVTVVGLTAAEWLGHGFVDLHGGVADAAVAGLSLLAGLLFALGVTVLEKAIEMDQVGPEPSVATSLDADRLKALSANALFTALLAGAGTGALIFASVLPALSCGLTILALGLLVAVGSTGVRVSARLFAETKGRTDRARSGVSRERHLAQRTDDEAAPAPPSDVEGT